ncbi:MAG TPA: hypothetical protein VM347_10800 [Nonomuraea sp.]|nr:hypothetical protein [Nonomuraea sp.]
MNEPMAVTFAELRAALDVVLTEAEERLGSVVVLEADYYWALPGDVYDIHSAPPQPALGQLSDDVESVRTFLAERDEDGHVIVWHELAHICGILRRIGAQFGP